MRTMLNCGINMHKKLVGQTLNIANLNVIATNIFTFHIDKSRAVSAACFLTILIRNLSINAKIYVHRSEITLSLHTRQLWRGVKDITWTTEEEEWMLIRRGRYAEFNLAIDRGTKYGIQRGEKD